MLIFAVAMLTYSTLNILFEEFTPDRFVMLLFSIGTLIFAIQ